jgi:hypothetical protein
MRFGNFRLMIGALLVAVGLFAQSSANIVGAVRDSSGSVVPAARVTATNAETGYSQTRQTDSNGAYELLLLPVGPYQVTVEKEGFQKCVQDIVLAVNDNATIDAAMSVGAVSEAVTMTGTTSLLETQSGTIKRLLQTGETRVSAFLLCR